MRSVDSGDDIPWLTPDEQLAWIGLLGLTVRLPALLDRDLKRTAGLSLVEYNVLAFLSDSPDRTLQMNQIASVAGLSLSRLSHLTQRLEQRGWVRRRPLPTDGRLTIATLTDEGYAVLAAAAPSHVRMVRAALFDRLDEHQVRQLAELLGRLDRGVRSLAAQA